MTEPRSRLSRIRIAPFIFLLSSEYRLGHPDQGTSQDGGADQDHQCGRKEGHYEIEGIIQKERGDQNIGSEEEKEEGAKGKHGLPQPPKEPLASFRQIISLW